MAIHFDEDPVRLYAIGVELGQKKFREELILKLWQKGFKQPKIAFLMDYHVDKVKDIVVYWKRKGYKKTESAHL